MSVAGAIADAIVAKVTSLALPGVTVARRKTPSLPQGVDPPQVVVSVGEEGDAEYLWAGSVLIRYPCAVTIFTGGGKKLLDDETLRTWRTQIRQAIDNNATYAGVSAYNTVNWSGKSPFARPALDKDINASLMTFTVEAIEARSSP